MTDLRCPACGAGAGPGAWRCVQCGSPLELELPRPDPKRLVEAAPGSAGVWRYLGWLPTAEPLTLGEPTTPLVALTVGEAGVLAKLEGAQPTGSFKDRGTAVLLAWLRDRGVRRIVEDSSGNAGASYAAYAARAGLACRIFVPADASAPKLAQLRAYGAEVVPVPGPRSAATEAAVHDATGENVYASHLWQPAFLAGTATFAYEIWEQLGGRVPDAVVVPLGGGTLLLGVHRGFGRLREAGLADRLPRLVGIQSAACDPLARAWSAGAGDAEPVEPGTTIAEGIRIARPPRSREILAAVRASGGTIASVSEGELAAALASLVAGGIYPEPTSAVAVAGLRQLTRDGVIEPDERVVVALTGHGLKAAATIANVLGA